MEPQIKDPAHDKTTFPKSFIPNSTFWMDSQPSLSNIPGNLGIAYRMICDVVDDAEACLQMAPFLPFWSSKTQLSR